jgi:hypothetical protein
VTKLEEYHARWVALRDEQWRIEARLVQIKKELPLVEAWMSALSIEPEDEGLGLSSRTRKEMQGDRTITVIFPDRRDDHE